MQIFKTLYKVYCFDFPVTLKNANGIIIRVSNIVIQTKSEKYKGLEKPSKSDNDSLKQSNEHKAITLVLKTEIKAVEITFPFSFSELKKRKKAVSIPYVKITLK